MSVMKNAQLEALMEIAHATHSGINYPNELCKLCYEEMEMARYDHVRSDELDTVGREEL